MNEDKKISILLFLLNVLITIQCICWYLHCCLVFNPGAGAGEVREQLNQAAGAQQQVTTGISNAQDTAKDLTGEINQAGTTVGRLEGEVQSSGDLIAGCQQILAEVLSRGAKNQAKVKATKEYWVQFGYWNVYCFGQEITLRLCILAGPFFVFSAGEYISMSKLQLCNFGVSS